MATDDRKPPTMYPGTFSPAPDLNSGPTKAFTVTPTVSGGLAGPTPTEAIRMAPGSLVGDRYQIREVLGVGGMGIVYRALDQTLDLEVALKVLRPEVAHDQEFLERFRNELIVARRVTHRNVVRIHDLGEHDGMYYMSMDLVEGRSLQDLLKEKGKLSLEEASDVVRQIAEALVEAHDQAVVHRDLKPANILLDADGRAYVSDFGVARSLHTPGLTQTGMVLGTPDYLSPEQARGEKVDGRSDLYSLGIMFVEMLSGKLPFPRGTLLEVLAQRMTGKTQSLKELGVETPLAFNAVVDRCLATDVAQRYQTASELIADLDDLSRPERRRRLRLLRNAAAIVAVALLAALGGITVWRWLEARPGPQPPSPSATEATPEAPLHSVAILPFPEETGRDDLAWASSGIAEMLASALAESESLRVADSVRVFQMLEDMGLAPARLRDNEIQQLAEILQVDRLVVGRLRSAGDRLHVEARLVAADQAGAPSLPVTAQNGSLDDLFTLVDQLGSTLREALEVPPVDDNRIALTPSSNAMRAYSEGLEHLARGAADQAAESLDRAALEDPNFTAAWVRLAEIYQVLGRHDEARQAARQAVRSTGERSGKVGYQARAQDALLRGESEEAQRILEQLVERYPNDTEARIALAEAYGQQGKFGDAISRLEEAVRVDPSDPNAWYLLGQYAIRSGDSRRAVDDYLVRALIQQKTLQNEAGQAEVHNAFGVGYENLGQLDEAIESYRTAAGIRRRIADRSGLAKTLKNLGMVFLARGDPDSAETNIRDALAIHTEIGNRAGIGDLATAYGFVEEERGRYSEALEHFRRSLQVRAELGDERALAESYNNVGYAYFILGEYDNAGLYLERSLALYEKNSDQHGAIHPLQSLGFSQLAQGRWSQASQSFLRALELSRKTRQKTTEAVSHGNLGLAAQHQGRYAAALVSYGNALEILKDLGDSRGQAEFSLHEAAVRLELGDLEGARALIDRAETWQAESDHQEQRSQLLGLRGQWHLARGELAQAEVLLAESLQEAEASGSAVASVSASVRAGLSALAGNDAQRALSQLRQAFAEAEELGHAVLQLRAGEALARAELANGTFDRAEEAIRNALRVSNDSGSYGGAYRLHHVLARILEKRGAGADAQRQLRQASAELARVRQDLDDELRRSFDQLPEVRELLAQSQELSDRTE